MPRYLVADGGIQLGYSLCVASFCEEGLKGDFVIMITLCAYVPFSQSSTMIGVLPDDKITESYVESVLTKHHVTLTFGASGLEFEIIMIFSSNDAWHNINDLLDAEIPKAEFNIFVSERRSFSPDYPPARWIHMLGDELKGLGKPPFSVKGFLAAEGLNPQSIRDIGYIPRTYLGLDGKYHVGFEVKTTEVNSEKRYQIMDANTLPYTVPQVHFKGCRQVIVGGGEGAVGIHDQVK